MEFLYILLRRYDETLCNLSGNIVFNTSIAHMSLYYMYLEFEGCARNSLETGFLAQVLLRKYKITHSTSTFRAIHPYCIRIVICNKIYRETRVVAIHARYLCSVQTLLCKLIWILSIERISCDEKLFVACIIYRPVWIISCLKFIETR